LFGDSSGTVQDCFVWIGKAFCAMAHVSGFFSVRHWLLLFAMFEKHGDR